MQRMTAEGCVYVCVKGVRRLGTRLSCVTWAPSAQVVVMSGMGEQNRYKPRIHVRSGVREVGVSRAREGDEGVGGGGDSGGEGGQDGEVLAVWHARHAWPAPTGKSRLKPVCARPFCYPCRLYPLTFFFSARACLAASAARDLASDSERNASSRRADSASALASASRRDSSAFSVREKHSASSASLALG